ncbi:MAG: TetR/AcrR family transcriptional regulator [Ilumatobacteraceae bacterium]
MADTRQRIVTATAELLRQRGYRATSLKDITAAAPATVGSVYHFFPGGKAELVRTAIVEMSFAYEQLFELVAGEAKDPADAFPHFFAAAADALEDTGYLDLCPIGTIVAEVAGTDEVLRATTADAFDRWTVAVAATLVRGGIAPDDAPALASTIIATLEGSFILARARRDAEPVRAAGRHVRALLESFVAGRGPRSVARSGLKTNPNLRQNA